MGAAVLQALSVLPMPVVFGYLYRVVAFRRPEIPRAALILGVAGPLILAVIAVVGAINELDVVDRITEGLRDDPKHPEAAVDFAEDERAEGPAVALSAIGAGGSLATAAATIFLAIHARRAGVLSSFMGILGVIVALFSVLVGSPPVVQWFWFGALGVLFLGRWPTARGPAWESGEAEPWPSAAEQRAAREGALPEAAAEEDDEPVEDEEEDDEPASADPDVPVHPRSRKRKRKRRR
ncbi:MAG: hypothetical protein M3340_04220 [Actinomycetota bacterium]|nr:hypothetical protein [Actinomycetota bacterium]